MNLLLLAFLASIFGAPPPKPPVRRRRRNVFAWSADPLEPRLVPSSIVQTLENGAVVKYDETRISRIQYRGVDILTGGGIYLVGSVNGRDVRETNLNSIGSKNGRMISDFGEIGPRFELKFTPEGPNRIKFVASVGPVGRDFERLDLAFDFNKQAVRSFAFGGTRLKFVGTGDDGWHNATPDQITKNGSRWRFNQIPQHQGSRDAYGRPLPKLGAAFTRNDSDKQWAKLFGPAVTIRIDVTSSHNYREMGITNHFVSHTFGFGFGPLKRGESASVEGYITITHR